MPIENLSQNAELRVKITSDDPKQIVDAIADLNRQLGYADTNVEGLEKKLAKLTSTTRKGAGGKEIGKNLSAGAGEGSRALDDLDQKVRRTRASAAGLSEGELPRLRYALYDVATTAGATSAALTGIVAATGIASARYESAFTAVERTSGVTGSAVDGLRNSLVQLTREVPLAFTEVSDLAARGAQLGVAAAGLTDFTETVAQFVATSDTVTLDQAVEAFGRISNLMGDTDFNRIGSAITLVGVNAAATEAQIVKTTQELAPFATAVGMTTDQVIGLASTLASLGQPPERARSAFLTLQQVMDNAIATGSDNLTAFAVLLGMTEEQVSNLWRTNPSEFITSFVNALGGVEDLTTAFSVLEINERRAVQVFQALAADARNAGDGMSVLERGLADSAQGYAEGTELARQYGLILDDLSSRWQILLNNIGAFGAAAGDAIAPALISIIDSLSGLLTHLTAVMQTPAGQFFAQLALSVMAVGAALTGIIAPIALAGGSLAALRTAISALGLSGATTGLQGFIGAMLGTAQATGAAAAAARVFRGALAGTGIGLVVVALGSLAEAFMQAGTSAEAAFTKYIGNTSGLSEALAADAQAYRQAMASGNLELANSFERLTPSTQANTGALDENAQAAANAAQIMGVSMPSGVGASTNAINQNTTYVGDNTIAWLRNALAQSEAFQQIVGAGEEVTSYWDALSKHGFSIDEMLRIAAAEGTAAVYDYVAAAEQRAIAAGENIDRAMKKFGSTGKNVPNLGGFWAWDTNPVGQSIQEIAKTASGAATQMRLLGNMTSTVPPAVEDIVDAGSGFDDFARSVGDAGKAAKELREEVRTTADYANDLGTVMSRAFEIRWGPQQALDTIRSGWQQIADRTEEANRQVAKYRADLKGLYADRDIKEYWLTVAEMYGDELRAAELRADLAKINTDVADTQKSLREEQAKASGTLVGNSKAAIENRAALLGLVGNYQQYLQALAASGASQEEVQAAAERLEREFVQQATQMGFNRQEVGKYTQSFRDMRTVIQQLPRNITVTANANPALQALREFEAQARKMASSVESSAKRAGSALGGIGSGSSARAGAERMKYMALYAEAVANSLRLSALSQLQSLGGDPFGAVASMTNATAQRVLADTYRRMGGFAQGGYTGDGGKYQPAGIVHKGEYVFSKAATQNLGVGNLAMLHKLGQSGQGFAAGSPVTSAGMGVMQLAPYDRMLLQTIADRVGITITESSLQGVVNGANFDTTRRRGA